MHELAIVREIIETVQKEASSHGLRHVSKARLKIGKMAAFRPEQLQSCFGVCERDGSLANMKLEVEEEQVELECERCHNIWVDTRFEDMEFAHQIAHNPIAYELPHCPKCRTAAPKVVSGNGVRLIEIEGE